MSDPLTSTKINILDLEASRKARPELWALVDRDCVILDGHCDCPKPALYNCKRYGNESPK